MIRPRFFILLLITRPAAAALSITDPGQGVFDFTGRGPGLSGLTFLGGNQYYAVSDSAGSPNIYPLTVNIDLTTGHIQSAATGKPLRLAAGADNEGIAFHAARNTFFVSDEDYPEGSYIREFDRFTGALIGTLSLPAVMLRDRRNLGLESLSFGAGALWTANERAFDHETAAGSPGSMVRLQKFDSRFSPAGQWAYLADPSNGVCDLLAMPGGELLVLERGANAGSPPGYRIRIYLVNFAGATDVSDVPDLDEGDFTRVRKTLLWERHLGTAGTYNFEGITLGSKLADGGYSVLLIADNDGGTQQHLYGLIIYGVIPEPRATFPPEAAKVRNASRPPSRVPKLHVAASLGDFTKVRARSTQRPAAAGGASTMRSCVHNENGTPSNS